ncbi:ABC transporter permease [Catenulispora subtropica]|uniref:ABC transporter permease subunit n=1 Tax=Catenulispora subtropica TaxID=450798 RepID=A0ABN2SZR0_9ACTN
MSTMTAASKSPVAAQLPAEPRPRFRDLCRMEWIKVASLRSTWFVLLAAAVATVFINLNGVHSDLQYIDRDLAHPTQVMPDGHVWHFYYDPLRRSLSRIAVQLMMLGGAAIGALTMFGEFSTGQIRTTFAAVPKRGGVVAAKVTVLCAITTVLALAVALVSFLGGQAMLASRHVGTSIGDHDAQIAIAAYTLVVPVCALVGMLFGALIRNATASIVAVVAFLFLLPAFFGGDKYRWVVEVGHLFPGNAEDTLTFWARDPYQTMGKWPASHTHAWLVYAGWAVISIATALVLVKKRDA